MSWAAAGNLSTVIGLAGEGNSLLTTGGFTFQDATNAQVLEQIAELSNQIKEGFERTALEFDKAAISEAINETQSALDGLEELRRGDENGPITGTKFDILEASIKDRIRDASNDILSVAQKVLAIHSDPGKAPLDPDFISSIFNSVAFVMMAQIQVADAFDDRAMGTSLNSKKLLESANVLAGVEQALRKAHEVNVEVVLAGGAFAGIVNSGYYANLERAHETFDYQFLADAWKSLTLEGLVPPNSQQALFGPGGPGALLIGQTGNFTAETWDGDRSLLPDSPVHDYIMDQLVATQPDVGDLVDHRNWMSYLIKEMMVHKVMVETGALDYALTLLDQAAEWAYLANGKDEVGDAGDNVIIGSDYFDFLSGGGGDDKIFGFANSDVLYGGGGDDLLVGGTGFSPDGFGNLTYLYSRDVLKGGAGNDRIFVDNLTDIGYSEGLADLGDTAYGGVGDDTIYGGITSDTLFGGVDTFGLDVNALPEGSDNDTIYGERGNDTIYGERGNDQLQGGDGIDTLYGGDGDDYLFGDAGQIYALEGVDYPNVQKGDYLYGEAGDDTLVGQTGEDSLFGGIGNDRLEGGDDRDFMYGGDGNDLLFGGAGKDEMQGGLGDDGLYGGSETDLLYGGEGKDSLNGGADNDVAYGGVGDDTVSGGDGSDQLYGGNDADVLSGDDGNDFLYGGSGDDVVGGGAGNDTVNGELGNDLLFGGAGENTLFGGDGIDRLVGGDDVDYIYGDADADTLWGEDGNDFMYGGVGDDSVIGALGVDTLYGGSGIDELDGGAGTDTLYGGIGDDSLYGGDDADTLNGDDGDDYLAGYNGDDRMFGDDGSDFMFGEAGNDVMFGGADDDVLEGGEDDDFLSGDDGDDEIYGGNGEDSIKGGEGDDTLFGEFGEFEILTGGADSIDGGAGDDYLDGGTGDDTLEGGTGHDILLGWAGGDYLFGGDGDDLILGFDGLDQLLGGAGADSMRGGQGADFIFGGDGDDELKGDDRFESSTEGGDDYIDGEAGNDTLYGDFGNDQLFGGDDNDTLDGGYGSDVLYGGSGNDRFIIKGTEEVLFLDQIFGGDGDDVIDLRELGLSYDIEITSTNGASQDGRIGFTNPDGADSVHYFEGIERILEIGDRDRTGDAPIGSFDYDEVDLADGVTASGNLVLNDTDPYAAPGDQLTVTAARAGETTSDAALAAFTGTTTIQGTYGSLDLNTDGSYTFTVDTNDPDTIALTYRGYEKFTYQVSDVDGLTDITELSITVVSVQDEEPSEFEGGGGETEVDLPFVFIPDIIEAEEPLVIDEVVEVTETPDEETGGGNLSPPTPEDPPLVILNAPVTGDVTLTGTAVPGSVITAVSNLADDDGLGELSYQWLRDGAEIDDQTATTYTLVAADLGAQITVSVSFTDGQGTVETATSFALGPVRLDVAGTSADDVLNGTDQPEVIDGLGGNDVISGGGSTDVLVGGGGDDHIYGDGFELRYALSEANQVFRLYQATFNRVPDEAGQKRWTNELFTDQSDLAQVRQGFVNSQEFRNTYDALDDADFVKQMYINVLDRDFDQGQVTQTEIDNWTNRITETFTRADVVNGFSESQQLINTTLAAANKLAVNGNDAAWSDDVYRLYRATLDRDPDATGFKNWSERLADGRPLTEVITGFTNSQEFNNTYGALTDPEDFVKQLYNNVLDRDFDNGDVTQTEIDNWVSRLSETFTRANIVEGFSQSVQFGNNTANDVKVWIRAQGLDDQIDGGAGVNALAGGTMADQFIFNQSDVAINTVLDLEKWDYLSFNGFGYATALDALDHMEQSGNHVVFADQDTEITFERFQLSDMTTDMILV